MEIVNTIDLRNNSKRKIFLHAAKYPASPIGGLLIGNITNDEITIENTFPLYHGTLVGPLIDIALLSIPSIYGSSSHVVGHYYSNELVVSESTPRFISNLTTSLNELNAFLTIELKKDAKLSSEVIYEIKRNVNGKTIYINELRVDYESLAVYEVDIHSFYDFEDHMDSSHGGHDCTCL